jgi:hypothetical protein
MAKAKEDKALLAITTYKLHIIAHLVNKPSIEERSPASFTIK